MKKAVLIISGGLDSTVLLYYLKLGLGWEVKALSFDYGQRHQKELGYAKRTCSKLSIDHHVVDLHSLSALALLSNSALTGNIAVPEGHYEQENMKLTVVPNRNMIMLSIAIGWAENLKFDYVSYANHMGDHAIYPDCRQEFVEALSKASELGTYSKIKLYSPFSQISKNEIARLGAHFGVDFDKDTWSCYKGEVDPCGNCGACNERKEALKYAWGPLFQA